MTDTRAESRQTVRAGVVVITKLARELRRGTQRKLRYSATVAPDKRHSKWAVC